jgi:ABC-2 type transport system ATP-binding protein
MGQQTHGNLLSRNGFAMESPDNKQKTLNRQVLASGPEIIVSVRDLKKTYKDGYEALKGVSFDVQRGDCFGILGPNGAGKSTTLEILQGLRKPSAGEVSLFGLQWKVHSSAIRRRLGGILQENKIYSKLKVTEALQLFASLYDNPLNCEEVLTAMKLQEWKNKHLKDLSGGGQQRVHLATALIGNPDLIFLDEPTTGLDPSTRQEFWGYIREWKNQGKTIVLTTHYMEEAEFLCEKIIVMDKGMVIESGSPLEMISRVMRDIPFAPRPQRHTLNDVFLTLTGYPLEP